MHHGDAAEFNLMQDVPSSRLVFDRGVPLVQIPCLGVGSHLLTTVPELEAHMRGRNAVCGGRPNPRGAKPGRPPPTSPTG